MHSKSVFLTLGAALLLSSCGGDATKLDPLNEFIMKTHDADLIPIQKTEAAGLVGYIDHDGNEVIPAQFTQAYYFSDDLAAVMDSVGNFRFIDRKGKPATDKVYASVSAYSCGLAWAAEADSALAAIDAKGNVKFRFPKATNALVFLDGYSLYSDSDGNMGIVTTDGVDVEIPEPCKVLLPMGDNYFRMETRENKVKIGKMKDSRVEVVSDKVPFEIINFSSVYKLAIVESDGKYGLADLDGNIKVNPRYDNLQFDTHGLVMFENEKDKYGWLKPDGEVAIPAKYAEINAFYQNDYTVVSTNGKKKQVINVKGEPLFSKKYESIVCPDYAGLLFIKDDKEKFGIISIDGTETCEPQFDNIITPANGMLMATLNGDDWGVVGINGAFKGTVGYKPFGSRALKMDADSKFFDVDYALKLITDQIDAFSFSTNMVELAEKYNLSKSDLNSRDVLLQNTTNRQLGMDLTTMAALDNPPLVSPSYWSNRKNINKNAKPTQYHLNVLFSSSKHAVETFKALKASGKCTVNGNIRDDDTYFFILVNENDSTANNIVNLYAPETEECVDIDYEDID